jgi:hypothetical protein
MENHPNEQAKVELLQQLAVELEGEMGSKQLTY